MYQSILTFLILIAYTSLNAQDKTMTFSDFDELSVSTSIKLELIPSNENKAEITIIKGDLDDLIVDQTRGELEFRFKSQNNWGKNNQRKAEITLYYKTRLESIDVNAGASVYSNEVMEATEFSADVNSGASLDLIMNAERIDSDVNSGGRMEIEGKVNSLVVDVDSGGHFDGAKLLAKDVEADADSGGYAKVFASESIRAQANSGGSIKYKGDPKKEKIKKDKWSGGSVRKM